MNFSRILGDTKFIEVIGSGLWSKKVKGCTDLSKKNNKTLNVKSCKEF